MSKPNIHQNVPALLKIWEEWARSDSVKKSVAGFPSKSITETVKDFHLIGQARTRTYETAKAKQTRSFRIQEEENTIAEAVEKAITYMRTTRLDLYHLLLADRLSVVPEYKSGIDKKLGQAPHKYFHMRRDWANSETEHRRRLLNFVGIGESQFWARMGEAYTFVGLYLDLNATYTNVREAV